MDSLKTFVMEHMHATIKGDRSLDRDAAYESARQDERWSQFSAHLERMGWMEASTKLMKRISKSIAEESDDNQDEFPFVPQILILDSDGKEIRFRADVNRSQFIRAMEVRRKNHNDVGVALKQMEELFTQLDLSWKDAPEMSFKDVVMAHKAGILAAVLSRRAR